MHQAGSPEKANVNWVQSVAPSRSAAVDSTPLALMIAANPATRIARHKTFETETLMKRRMGAVERFSHL